MSTAFATFLSFIASFFGKKGAKEALSVVPYKDTGLYVLRIAHGESVVEELLPRGFQEWPKERIESEMRRIVMPKVAPAMARAARNGQSRRVTEVDVARIDKAEQRRVRRGQRGGIS